MKYMGSKRWMLRNGLASTLNRHSKGATRFVDLFSGSGAVAAYVAQRNNIPVVACDLQSFSSVLALAVIGRTRTMDAERIWIAWQRRAEKVVRRIEVPTTGAITLATVAEMRAWCSRRRTLPITKAYGGHYFSPTQAVWIDALRDTLPQRNPQKTLALAALIMGASQSAASPGHTAQPFQPTRSAKKYLKKAWELDVSSSIKRALTEVAGLHALCKGIAQVGDANTVAETLRPGDLAFVDPPYSGVHYSRFYHVLETIARGQCGEVSGTGRYPESSARPRSKYSIKSESIEAMEGLLATISKKKAKAIVTFPSHKCSNGLSGEKIAQIARSHFEVSKKCVKSKFSTLGGVSGSSESKSKGNGRAPRQYAIEYILVLQPKKSSKRRKTS